MNWQSALEISVGVVALIAGSALIWSVIAGFRPRVEADPYALSAGGKPLLFVGLTLIMLPIASNVGIEIAGFKFGFDRLIQDKSLLEDDVANLHTKVNQLKLQLEHKPSSTRNGNSPSISDSLGFRGLASVPKLEKPDASSAGPVPSGRQQKVSTEKAASASCPLDFEAETNIRWVIQSDPGARRRYDAALSAGKSPYLAVLVAQSHNRRSQDSINSFGSTCTALFIKKLSG